MKTAGCQSRLDFAGVLRRLPRLLAGALIGFYRFCLSPLKPACCRFSPTCSAYAAEAVRRFGVRRGGWLALRRLLRCHPFYHGSLLDPVPGEKSRGTPPS